MSFKDNLRPGSFRGVPFFIDTSQKGMGRRAVLHEFPNRETPFTEDLGRIAETYEVEGHVIGDDYFAEKTKLEKAFNQEGVGELIHPFWGSLQVQIGPVTISESNIEGAIAKFSAKFFEKGDNRFPKGINDKGAILADAVSETLTAIDSDFEEKFSIEKLPANAIQSARDAVEAVADKMNVVTKIGGAIADGVTEVAFATRNLVAELDDLLQAPAQLASRLQDSFAFLQGAFTKSEDKAKALSQFFNSGDDQSPIIQDTPIRNQEKSNLSAINNFVKMTSAVRAAETAANGDYASFNDAENARVEITDVIEQQIRLDDGTDIFQALADVNALLVDALPDLDADLPNIKTITTDVPENTLNLTYDLFEKPENESDIISRNNIRNPGAISEGTTLEVLDE
tara:strand:+ start:12121 stop:13314 length:1194 start_codon:yes stop_codon:yes gene_type:complete